MSSFFEVVIRVPVPSSHTEANKVIGSFLPQLEALKDALPDDAEYNDRIGVVRGPKKAAAD